MKKVNPHRKPATQADVKKAELRAQQFAVNAAMAMFLSVMRDKEGYGPKRLQRIWAHVNDLADSIAQGYVKVPELVVTLEEEAGIIFNKGEL